MHQQQSRRSKRTTRRREQLNSSGDSSDSSLSREIIQSSHPTTPRALPLSVIPSLMTTAQSTIATQTVQNNLITQSFHSKSIPSFAETQLLSIYYLNRNITNQLSGSKSQDHCVFVEQQERQPIRFRATYDPSASAKSTQTSPPLSLKELSTHGSTLVVGSNQQTEGTNNPLYEQRLKIHSGSQRLANNPSLISETDELVSPSELIEETRYSYEEYIIHVGDNQEQNKQASSSSTTSTSSVTTIIAQSPPPPPPRIVSFKTMPQPEEIDSDRTSRLSGDEINTHSTTSSMSGSFTNQDWTTAANTSSKPSSDLPIVNTRQTTPATQETTRVSSWPPVPYDMPSADTQFETSFILEDNEEQKRPSRVQFAEQLVHVIPASATNSLSEEFPLPEPPPPPLPTFSAPAIIPRTTTNRTNSYEQNEQQAKLDVEEDDTTTTTTTSSNKEQISGRLQRASGLANLNEVIMTRPTTAPPPPPSHPPPPPPPPPSSSTTTTTTTTTPTGVDPRLVRDQLKRLDYQLLVDTRHPVNQSKWVKDHMDAADVQPTTTTTSGRVDALRSLFEQQSGRSSDSSTLNSPTGQIKRIEPEERPSRHGDEIRFRIKQPKTSTIHHAEPVQVIQRTKQSTPDATLVAPLTWEDLVGVQQEHQQQRRPQILSSPFELDEIQHIVGKRIKSLDDIGYYSQVK
jgi:hypothetical protein